MVAGHVDHGRLGGAQVVHVVGQVVVVRLLTLAPAPVRFHEPIWWGVVAWHYRFVFARLWAPADS